MRIKTARTGNDNKIECSATLREIVQENRVHRRGVEHSSTVTEGKHSTTHRDNRDNGVRGAVQDVLK